MRPRSKRFFLVYISKDYELNFYVEPEKYMELKEGDLVYLSVTDEENCLFVLKRTKQGKGSNPHLIKERNHPDSIRKYVSCPETIRSMGGEPMAKYQAYKVNSPSYKGIKINFNEKIDE